MFYKEFTRLKFLDTKPEKRDHKFTVLNNASDRYNNELTPEYKKVYEIEPKDDKSDSGSKNMTLKILKPQIINQLNQRQNHCLMRIDQILNR